jgi:ketosteroid isomerase-like protein
MVVYTRRRRCLHGDVDAGPDPIEQVRAIWSAYQRGGVDALREVVPPDVEWVPVGMRHGIPPEEFWESWVRRHSEEISITVHGFERHGSCVLAHGSLRTFREGGFFDVQPSWVYFFNANRLRRCVGYATREEALGAISAYRDEA